MKRTLLGILLWLGAASAAFAQPVPTIGVNTANLRVSTYSAVSVGLVPAASATDIFCISGSTTRNIQIRRISVSGVAGTLVSTPFVLVKRASLDTGGTAASTIANPANTTTKHASTNGAATATLIAYTANPTIVDASPGYLRADYLTLPTAAAGTVIVPLFWEFGTSVDAYNQGADIVKGVTTQYCLNAQGATITTGLLNVSIEWNEQQ